MQDSTANVVYPFFRYGLRLKERLRLQQKADMDAEQNALKRLFSTTDSRLGSMSSSEGAIYLGFRYPLACWLDEVFILDADSPWKERWREKAIEVSLFGERLRAARFWEQCRMAELRGDADALEVFYLCVLLGFRGDLRDDPDRLHKWRESVEVLIARNQPSEWEDRPPDLPLPEPHVPPLYGRQRLGWLYSAWAVLVGLVILLTAFWLVYSWTK
jgi:type VI secretion system protein ImpK